MESAATPPIFNPVSRNKVEEELSRMTGQEYIDTFGIGTYFQDVVKLILDKREEKPLELLSEYFEVAARGEHIVMRDYAFINATQYNRASFLNHMGKVFHSTPYYNVITALDYHQCLCLLCSDFPRTLVVDAARIIPVHQSYINNPAKTTAMTSTLSHEPLFFDKFDLTDLRNSIELLFFYSEFLGSIRQIMTDMLNGAFTETEEVSVSLLVSSLRSLYARDSGLLFTAPPLEIVIEVLLPIAQKKLQLEPDKFHILNEVMSKMQNCGTISYSVFCFNLMKHPRMQKIVYGQFNPPGDMSSLAELAVEEQASADLTAQAARKKKKEKKK